MSWRKRKWWTPARIKLYGREEDDMSTKGNQLYIHKLKKHLADLKKDHIITEVELVSINTINCCSECTKVTLFTDKELKAFIEDIFTAGCVSEDIAISKQQSEGKYSAIKNRFKSFLKSKEFKEILKIE